MLMNSYAYYLSMYVIMKISICYSWMMHGKRKELQCCAKIGIVMPLLIFKIQYTN
jgi:hypothetical protein